MSQQKAVTTPCAGCMIRIEWLPADGLDTRDGFVDVRSSRTTAHDRSAGGASGLATHGL